MMYPILSHCILFKDVPLVELEERLEEIPHHLQQYKKNETIFYSLEDANHIGILLSGRVQSQKTFPNGSQINVTVRHPGEMIGHGAAFSYSRKYPCDVIALEECSIMIFKREDMLLLMQKDIRILENFTKELASSTFMLQQRLELLSYNGIAQKAAFYLLTKQRELNINKITIPSMTKWAMILNVSRPSLHREIKRLENEHLIRSHDHVIDILDKEGLQDILSK